MKKVVLFTIPLFALAGMFPALAQEAKSPVSASPAGQVAPAGVGETDDGKVGGRGEGKSFYRETQTKDNFEKYAGSDGALSPDEFREWQKDLRGEAGYDTLGGRGENARDRFKMADKNNDGVVDLQEARAQKKWEMENRKEIFNRAKEKYGDDQSSNIERMKTIEANNPALADKIRENRGMAEKAIEANPAAARRTDEFIRNNPGAGRAVGDAASRAGEGASIKAGKAALEHKAATKAVTREGMRHKDEAGQVLRDASTDRGKAAIKEGRNKYSDKQIKNKWQQGQNNKAAAKNQYKERRRNIKDR